MDDSRRSILGYAALLAVGIVLVYANSLHGPFVLDDTSSIATNPSIRGIVSSLQPPVHQGLTVESRPILNLSLALNYAVGGLQVEGYHVVNLLLHMGSALLLFGLLRRTIRVAALAFACTACWALHPLETSAVTYVIQRAESLMAFFYLATLYAFARATATPGKTDRGWSCLCVLACALGMATKEVMVSAPLVVLLYDRAFRAHSIRGALAQRLRLYGALAATWLILVWLVCQSGGRGGTSGFESGVSPLRYWAAQSPAILHYLRLVVWPAPLVFDYGTSWFDAPLLFWPQAVVLIALLGLTGWTLVRRPALGFTGAFFFLVLAPSSLVPGNRQILAEHRMYLSLAAIVVLAAIVLSKLDSRRRGVAVAGLSALAIGFGVRTHARNRDYRSALALYSADVAATPDNVFALSNEATALLDSGRYAEAATAAQRALVVRPHFAAARDNLGTAWLHLGQPHEAEAEFRGAVDDDPKFAGAWANLGTALVAEGRVPEAMAAARRAVALEPTKADFLAELGAVDVMAGSGAEGIGWLRQALVLDPALAEARLNLGIALGASDQWAEAVSELRRAVALESAGAPAWTALGQAEAKTGDLPAAEGDADHALSLDPTDGPAHELLGTILLRAGEVDRAVAHYRMALSASPGRADYHYNLANGLLQAHQPGQAEQELERALALDPALEAAQVLLQRLRGSR